MRKNNFPTPYASKADGTIDVDRVIDDFCRALENRAPQLGAVFRDFLCSRRKFPLFLTQYIFIEFDYLNQKLSPFDREFANEFFRLVLAGSGGESFYLAVRDCVHSMATSMARDALAADVDAVIGGDDNAN